MTPVWLGTLERLLSGFLQQCNITELTLNLYEDCTRQNQPLVVAYNFVAIRAEYLRSKWVSFFVPSQFIVECVTISLFSRGSLWPFRPSHRFEIWGTVLFHGCSTRIFIHIYSIDVWWFDKMWTGCNDKKQTASKSAILKNLPILD